MENKSEELAKLLNLKRKYCKKCDSRGYMGDRYVENPTFECCMCHCTDYITKFDTLIDFELDENFIKLFDLMSDWNLQIFHNRVDIGGYIAGDYFESLKPSLIHSILRFGEHPDYKNKGKNMLDELIKKAQKIKWRAW